ncbi:hypothetical protein AC1031_011010 [Aphanomyces cochlioides]|nr:hypothetical protein AC1031_011010 [Aphanomyces cochlioides]
MKVRRFDALGMHLELSLSPFGVVILYSMENVFMHRSLVYTPQEASDRRTTPCMLNEALISRHVQRAPSYACYHGSFPSSSSHGSLIFQFPGFVSIQNGCRDDDDDAYQLHCHGGRAQFDHVQLDRRRSVTASAMSGAFVAAANQLSPFFRHHLSISGKVSIVGLL